MPGSRIAVFPGSFDPITKGHEDVVRRAAALFDKLIVAIGQNQSKKYMFSREQRIEWITKTFADLPQVVVMGYSGLTIEFCREVDASYMIRGLRNPADFEFEKAVAQANREMHKEIETVFFLTSSSYSYISSSIVRDVINNDGDYTRFVPKEVRI